MQFDHDVFISYPHLSNREGRAGREGWVERFHADLDARLSEMLGRPARIWRDNSMAVGASIGDTVRARLRGSRALLCVVSPAYVNSEDWCLEELREFRAAAERNGGLVLGEQARIIPVIKTPTDPLPEGLDKWLCLNFYETGEETGGEPAEFSQTEGGRGYEKYERGVTAVASAIKRVAGLLGGEGARRKERPTVYLAETTADREDNALDVRQELESRGLTVLPEKPIVWKTADQYAAAVRECLRRSFMSVHLMGASYGTIPDGGGKSLPHIQNELAAKRSVGDEQFSRVIWVPKGLRDVDPKQSEFLDDLRESDEALAGAELLERSLQQMKTRLLQILKRREEKKDEPPPSLPGRLVSVYLMWDKADDALASPVGTFLYGKGFNVMLPPEKGRISYHRKYLVSCDATLTIYGKAEYDWVFERYEDVVKKARGWGRERDVSCQAILRTDPETERKSMIFLHSVKVLPPCYEDVSDAALTQSLGEFIAAISGGPAAAEGGAE